MNKHYTKSEEIKIRISKQDKNYLQNQADKQNIPLSDYIRSICLSDINSRVQQIPDAVETWDTYNEILLTVNSTGNKNLSEAIKSIIAKQLTKVTNTKELKNEGKQ
jgi:hypothetical protein